MRKANKYKKTHQGNQEKARRIRQALKGMLNGFIINKEN